MANLAEKREPRAWSPRAVWTAIDELRDAVKFLRSSLDVVGRATIERGRSLLISGGGGIDVRDGGVITGHFPSGGFAAYYGALANAVGGLYYGIAAVTPLNHSFFVAFCSDDPDDKGSVQTNAGEVYFAGQNLATLVAGDNFFEANTAVAIMQHTNPGDFPNFVQVDDSGVNLQAATGTHRMPGMGTTGAAANLTIDFTTAVIKASVSSRRYKQDIEDAVVDVDQVLKLVPRRFRMKDDVDELGDEAPWRVGFIAEEAHDLGLSQWVSYNADGNPEAFDYPTFCVAQQAVLANMQQQLQTLTEHVTALEAGA